MLSTQCWEDSKDNPFDSFSQQESIADRIKGILNDYDPSDIFNEFLQNASDAGATECRFWLDAKEYSTEKVLGTQMVAWQGPALMIYNDAEFSDKDFEALCKLGIGNKKDDPSKIGRHGLGFNSVYHFTDVPSIVSGPYLGFFDPQMTNLPKSRDRNGNLVAKGGYICDFRKLNVETFGDQLEPYKAFLGCDMKSHFKGTLFRIPLRMRPTEFSASKAGVKGELTAAAVAGSKFGDVQWTKGQIQKMMEKWVDDAKIGMLFIKNVKIIQISDGLKPGVQVEKKLLKLLTPNAPSALDSVFMIDVSPDVSKPSENVTSSQWLVCCDDIFPSDTLSPVRHLAVKKNWSPHRGVAIKIQDTDSEFHSKLFVHLPTPINTHLPFHIHGDFALTSSRKSLAGGKEEEDEKRAWNSFLMEKCLTYTAIRAMVHLFTMHFLDPSSPVRDHDGCNTATAAYFKHWPFRSTVEFQPFLKAFLCQTYSSSAFPCPGATTMYPMQLKAGRDAIFPGLVTIPIELEAKVIPWLSKGNRAVCIIPDPVMSVIKAQWSKESAFSFKEVDGDFIRKRLRETPDYIKNNMTTRSEKEWILGWAFQPVLNPMVRFSVTSNDLQIIPLLNGEWIRLKYGKKKYYVPSQNERDLLGTKDILIDTDVFSTPELERALDLLIKGGKHNVGILLAENFAETFRKENPDGVTDQHQKQLWDYLEVKYTCEALDAFYDFPILKTSYGNGAIATLGKAKTGFQISGLPPQTALKFYEFMGLLRDLDITVYSSETHRSHQFFEAYCPKYSDLRLLDAIVTHWNNLSTYRAFSTTEAKGMRDLVLACSGRIEMRLMSSVGRLPIWTTLGSTENSPLIAACDAYFLEGHFDLDKFEAFPTVLCSVNAVNFKPMGAAPLKVTAALTDLVLPKFHSGALKCDGGIRTAYLVLLKNLFYVSQLYGKFGNVARNVMATTRCYVARDGSFHSVGELFVPGEALTEMLFADQLCAFADQEMALLMSQFSLASNLRSLSSSPNLVVICADKVLKETVDVTADRTTTRTRAVQLIQYLYKNPDAGGVDWMDAKWKFVPREANLEWPFDVMAPQLPLYMAFSDLASFSTREATWTQFGFFPVELPPSPAFRVRFPAVRTTKLNLADVLKHLNIVVRDIAPTWNTTEKQLRLKAILLNIYAFINHFVGSSITNQEWMVQHEKEFLKCPYILNGNNKDSSNWSSWLWPEQLMFGIINDVPPYHAADPGLHHYLDFLLALGAKQIQPVEASVYVPDGRLRGDMEDQMLRCFESQDQEAGFMDVRFKFQKGSDIQAHNYGDIRVGFWGLLHYFYSNTLTLSNGPPRYNEDDQGSMGGSLADGDDDDVDIDTLGLEDKLSERLQFLMKLQHVAHQFEVTRLKDLIAKELIEGQKVAHNNVFTIRVHAERNNAENVCGYCNEFIEKNRESVMRQVQSEIRIVEDKLNALDGQGKGKAGEGTNDGKLKKRLLELQRNQRELLIEP
ncbi:hypothetical protein BGX24_009002 [Mortierella sp. AD032]|nr:hypothetical protein BGX24_009002 [Mortierella sp. AD032]